MGASFDLVTSRLAEVTGYSPPREGGPWRCPAHDDKTPSLGVSNGAGKVLLTCRAGCETRAVLEALSLTLTDTFDEPPQRPSRSQIVDRYPYVDEAGELLFEVVRLEGKQFRQRRPDGSGGWVWKLDDTRRVLYRLPKVKKAVAGGRSVFVAEGEKDVHALEAAGEVATCNPGGAGKWRPEYADVLSGAREVFIVADRDDAGRRHAREVETSLKGRVGSVIVVEAVTGKDAADHLGAGHSVDELVLVADGEHLPEDPRSTAIEAGRVSAAASPNHDDLFRLWGPAELLDADRTFQWRVRGLLVRPTYGMLAGERKTLKSHLATFLTVAVASGAPVFDHFVVDDPAPVLAYVGEGGRVPYTRRLERVAAAMGVDLRQLPLFSSFDVAPTSSDVFRETLARDLVERAPGLVVLDPLYAFHGPATNAANLFEEGALLSALSAPCVDAGASLLVLSHFNKTGTGRGLDRITQAGGQEWSDSWILVSHREAPDVPGGRFRLLLEIGSRQWGGTEWNLDLNVGRFDVELGEFDGDITWELRRHEGEAKDSVEAKVLALVDEHPGELVKEELARAAGGNMVNARALVVNLEDRGLIVPERATRKRSDGKPHQVWAYRLAEPPSEAGRSETEAGW